MSHKSNIITFTRLTEIEPYILSAHMNDPKIAEHMPLLKSKWDEKVASNFVALKETYWEKDGLGHWAILSNGSYVGWGGFQKEGNEWDYGLVLKSDAFGLGMSITKKALGFAKADTRIPFVTFLLPPSRKKQAALKRLGAQFVGNIDYNGEFFYKYSLETTE